MESWHQKLVADCGMSGLTFNRADGSVVSAFSKKAAEVEAECVWLVPGQLDFAPTYSHFRDATQCRALLTI